MKTQRLINDALNNNNESLIIFDRQKQMHHEDLYQNLGLLLFTPYIN